jgi:hypothetical protein
MLARLGLEEIDGHFTYESAVLQADVYTPDFTE